MVKNLLHAGRSLAPAEARRHPAVAGRAPPASARISGSPSLRGPQIRGNPYKRRNRRMLMQVQRSRSARKSQYLLFSDMVVRGTAPFGSLF